MAGLPTEPLFPTEDLIHPYLFRIMAQQEEERENLLRDATAYVERASFSIPGKWEEVFIGFRTNGAMSIYFDQDPVYHFNTKNELRRAFIAGDLYKAEKGRLVRLRRDRTEKESQLVRHELSRVEQEKWIDSMKVCLQYLKVMLQIKCYSKPQERPAAKVIDRVANLLEDFEIVSIASGPGATGQ